MLPKRHINHRRNKRKSFQIRFSRRARASTSPVVACFVIFSPARPSSSNTIVIDSTRGTDTEKCKHATPRSVRILCVLRLEMQRAPEARHQSAAQLGKSFTSCRARDHLQAPLLLVRFRIFFARGSIVMRHDSQLTGREHNFRTDRQKKIPT